MPPVHLQAQQLRHRNDWHTQGMTPPREAPVDDRGRMNLGKVAEALGVHPSNAPRTVERLVVAGLLRRTEDPSDRRYLALELTDAGHDVVQGVMGHRREAIAAI